jgi:hypothetical protein
VLTIDRLSLRLPPSFGERAEGLARLIGDRLASVQWSRDASVDHLRVDHALATADTSDEALARDIAAAVARQVRGGL